jgi:hypothetical protein
LIFAEQIFDASDHEDANARARVVLADPSSLPVAFDDAASSPKLVLLVSPTCPICLEGVQVVREALAEFDDGEVATHVVWLPVLKGDTAETAQESAQLLSRIGGVAHYWDSELFLSKQYCNLLGLEERGRTVAWDLYFLYERGVRWTVDPPMPSVWMQQLLLDDVPELDRLPLVDHLRQMLEAPAAEESMTDRA